ncbi:hypothetical protein QCA50_003560 [Cerrena zonata]|uniref:FAD-binding domain-containing protein n=1 Tax=Cerrena zonata TaxID=2478898 RepID=A0AAW0GWL8_9APHY
MSSTSRDVPLKIAICGGGIGGLSLALVLKRFAEGKHLTVDLYEAEADFTEFGAGITLSDRPRSILYKLGFEEELRPMVRYEGLQLRKSDTLQPFAYHELGAPNGHLGLPRIETIQLFLRALASNSDSSVSFSTHFSKRLESYTQDDSGVTIHFQDSSAASADVLLAADGIGSRTRRTMYTDLADRVRGTDPKQAEELEKHITPIFTGTYQYRTLINGDKLRSISPNNVSLRGPTIFTGSGQSAISYPISSSLVNVGFLYVKPEEFGMPRPKPSVTSASKQEVVDLVKGWEDDVVKVAETADKYTKWALSQVDIPQFVDGRVALLGDAAHAMLPALGIGAGQAMEDAYILGRLLTQSLVTARDVGKVLDIYDTIRRPIAHEVSDRSLRMSRMLFFFPNYMPADVDVEKLKINDKEEIGKVAKEMEKLWSFNYTNMPEEDWIRARDLFNSAIGESK